MFVLYTLLVDKDRAEFGFISWVWQGSPECPVWHVNNLDVITPILTTGKKAEQTENQQLFLDPPKNVHRANHHLKTWRDK